MGRGPEQPLLDVFLRPIGAFGWQAARLAEASTVLPGDADDYSAFYESFQGRRAEWNDHLVGSGTITALELSGGIFELVSQTTGGTSYASTGLTNALDASAGPGAFSLDAGQPFYIAGRVRFAASLGAGSFATFGTISTGNLSFVALGRDGTLVPSGHLVVEVEGAAPDYNFGSVDTGIVPGTDFRDIRFYFDGTDSHLLVDDLVLGPYTQIVLPVGGIQGVRIDVSTTASTGTAMDVDEFLVVGALTS